MILGLFSVPFFQGMRDGILLVAMIVWSLVLAKALRKTKKQNEPSFWKNPEVIQSLGFLLFSLGLLLSERAGSDAIYQIGLSLLFSLSALLLIAFLVRVRLKGKP